MTKNTNILVITAAAMMIFSGSALAGIGQNTKGFGASGVESSLIQEMVDWLRGAGFIGDNTKGIVAGTKGIIVGTKGVSASTKGIVAGKK